ncbi:HlyD family type I secretion periplasmic adaptor subunit [Sphingopyxis sp. LARHCG72]
MKPRTASNLLLWAIAGFVAIFLIWAWLTELDRTVRGPGRVIPSAQLQIVSNLEGGVVEQILVRTGQQVKAGAVLLRLSPIQSGADLGSGEATAFALRAKVARIEAELSGRSPAFPEASDAQGAAQVEIERALYGTRMADLASLRSVGEAQVAQARQAIAEARSAHAARVAARDAARAELSAIRPLVERGIEPRLSLIQAESRASVAASEAAAAASAITRSIAAAAEAQASLSRTVQDWRTRSGLELAAARSDLDARRLALPALADRASRTIVRAPMDGFVNRVLVATVGGSVAPGAPLVELVPGEKSLLVEAMVLPKDIAGVKIGQPSRVDITAYDSAIYGSLHGKVVTISPDAVLDERTGESHYLVRVRTGSNVIRHNGRSLPIGPGMTATVNLLGDKRSVLNYILTPISRIRDEALRE